MNRFRLLPEQASTYAEQLDPLVAFVTAVTAVMTLLIFVLVVYFALRYRRRSPDERPRPVIESKALEVIWTAVPTVVVLIIFFWGARTYFMVYKDVPDALDIHVIGKQWMWKVQHPNGTREINSLHVPRGQRIALTIASQDVIHSFYIPAFRIKQDAVPGRYSRMVFEARPVWYWATFIAAFRFGALGWPFLTMTVCSTKFALSAMGYLRCLAISIAVSWRRALAFER